MTAAFLAIYLAAMLAIGIATRRRASAGERSFYLADRSYGPWRAFAALASTTTGGSATIVCAALVYRHGLAGIWLDLSGAIGLFLLGAFLAARVRRTGAFTLPEIAGRFYGPRARAAAGALVVAAEIAWFALLTEASQIVLTATLGVSPVPALLISAAVFIAYTALGGQYAVVATDLVQYTLMVTGILLVGTIASAQHFLPALREAAGTFPVSPTLGWPEVFGWLVLIGLPHLVGGDIYSKLLSCRDERTARLSAFGAAASKLAFGASVAAIALGARAAGLARANPSEALPSALVAFAPGILGSFAAVALLATMQSSADSVLLTAASATVRDVAPLLGRQPGFRAARRLVPLYGGLGLLLALGMREIVETLKLGYSIFAAGMILPILFGFFPALWGPAADAIVAMFAGGAAALLGRFFPGLLFHRDPVIVGSSINLGVLLLAIVRTRAMGRCPGDYGLTTRAGAPEKD